MKFIEILPKIKVGTNIKIFVYTSERDFTGESSQFSYARSDVEQYALKKYYEYPVKTITTNVDALEIDLIDVNFKWPSEISGNENKGGK